MRNITSTQRLAEEVAEGKLGQPLPEWIADRRAAVPRWSWSLLAAKLAETAGVEVTDTTLRNWYGTEVAA